MRTIKFISLLILSSLSVSCSKPGNQSILEPLSTQQQDELCEKYDFHPSTFQVANYLGGQQLSVEEKERYGKLTYARINDFYQKYTAWDESKAASEWTALFQSKLDSVPVIMEKYTKELEANYPENRFAKVKWIKASIDNEGSVVNVANVKYRITPIQPIEGFELIYGIVDKGNTEVFKFNALWDYKNVIKSEQPISIPTVYDGYMFFRSDEVDETDFNHLSPDQLADKYEYAIVFRVKVNGKWHSKWDYYDSLPFSVSNYWENEKKPNWEDNRKHCTANVASDYFGIKILEKHEYVELKRIEYLQQLDPQVFELVDRAFYFHFSTTLKQYSEP